MHNYMQVTLNQTLILTLTLTILSGFWTLCYLFFPCPSWVSLYGYFPVLVKLIWLFLAPVLVLLDYVWCVYKSLVLPESLSVHSSIYVVFSCVLWFGYIWIRRTYPNISPASFPYHTTMTDERTPSQKDDCSWGRAVGFAAGWSEVGTVCGGFPRAYWFHPFSPHAENLHIPHQRLGPPAHLQTSPYPPKLHLCSQPRAAVRCEVKATVRGQSKPNGVRGSFKPAGVRGSFKAAAVRGSFKAAAIRGQRKPAGGSTCAPGIAGGIWGYELEPSSRARSSTAPSRAHSSTEPSSARSSRARSSVRSSRACSSVRSSRARSSVRASRAPPSVALPERPQCPQCPIEPYFPQGNFWEG